MSSADPIWLDASRPADVERYLADRGLLSPDGRPIAVAIAGAGNMNVTLRVTPPRGRSFILKQGRPWVAKYPQIPAPVGRTLVEAAFYQAVSGTPAIARMMPTLMRGDSANHVLVFEDVGAFGDCTSLYQGATLSAETLDALLGWLAALASVTPPADRREIFANRAMRTLNHEHIFLFPLRAGNGLDLDAITPGLGEAARGLQADRAYGEAVERLGARYLADSRALVHGDFFPGSWLHAADGIRVIDPEFCFLGDREFDYGVLAAHLLMAGVGHAALASIENAVERQALDAQLVHRYSGAEIMRRLIGVAQLPLTLGLEQKRELLQLSRRLVLSPEKGFA